MEVETREAWGSDTGGRGLSERHAAGFCLVACSAGRACVLVRACGRMHACTCTAGGPLT